MSQTGVKYTSVGRADNGHALQVDSHDNLVDSHDNLIDHSGAMRGGTERLLRNPKIMKYIILLLGVLLIITIGSWNYTATHTASPGTPTPDDSSVCPAQLVSRDFEALYRSWAANLILYIKFARDPCDTAQATRYLKTLLPLNAHSIAGTLEFYRPGQHLFSVSIIQNVTTSIQGLIDATMTCSKPACNQAPFGVCNNPSVATMFQNTLVAYSENMVQYVEMYVDSPYDLGQLRSRWLELIKALLEMITLGTKNGAEFNPAFDEASLPVLQQAAIFGAYLDYNSLDAYRLALTVQRRVTRHN